MKGNFQLKLTIFLLFFSFWGLKPTWGQEQCEITFSHSIEDATNLSEGGAIYISLNGEPSAYTFKLYDLFEGKVIQEKVLNTLKVNEKILLFDDLPASAYTIYVTKKDCENFITLGGKLGLVVGDK